MTKSIPRKKLFWLWFHVDRVCLPEGQSLSWRRQPCMAAGTGNRMITLSWTHREKRETHRKTETARQRRGISIKVQILRAYPVTYFPRQDSTSSICHNFPKPMVGPSLQTEEPLGNIIIQTTSQGHLGRVMVTDNASVNTWGSWCKGFCGSSSNRT